MSIDRAGALRVVDAAVNHGEIDIEEGRAADVCDPARPIVLGTTRSYLGSVSRSLDATAAAAALVAHCVACADDHNFRRIPNRFDNTDKCPLPRMTPATPTTRRSASRSRRIATEYRVDGNLAAPSRAIGELARSMLRGEDQRAVCRPHCSPRIRVQPLVGQV